MILLLNLLLDQKTFVSLRSVSGDLSNECMKDQLIS